ncbi:MAG: hypothetical protein J7K04_11750 [Spirochaetales bacterium]|nr:hypothetical protein [Spirochaetales bacterium]
MSSEVKEKVESLEYLVKEIAKEQLRSTKTLNRFMEGVEKFKDEMHDFKDEMLALKDEMLAFKDEMHDFKDEMLAFKDEMRDFKDEMLAFKDEMRDFKYEMSDFKVESQKYREEAKQDRRDMNKKWGDLANKMGTIIEDIVFPATAPVIRKYFKEEPYDMYIRRKARRGDKSAEFDVVAVTKKRVYLVDVKSNPTERDVSDFHRVIERFREFAPEYEGKELISIFASVYLPVSLVNLCSREGFYAMSYREWDYMDILNFDKIKKYDRI